MKRMASFLTVRHFVQGILFILVQRPYGIGDRICVGNTEAVASQDGSQGWIVDNVTLYTTTVVLAATNERATISNGCLAKSRIINGARSPQALLYVYMKFGVEVPYQKVEIFRSSVEKFVKSRPREWLSLGGFRANRIEADLGFIEYCIVLQHREAWQNIVPILDSKQTIYCFCLELAKKLDMRYKSPPLPVDLNFPGSCPGQFEIRATPAKESDKENADLNQSDDFMLSPKSFDGSEDLRRVAAMFDDR